MTKSRRKSKRRRHGGAAVPQPASKSAGGVTPGAAAGHEDLAPPKTSTSVPRIKSEPRPEPETVPASSWKDRLFEPIDIASIAVFRICLGLLLLYDMYNFHAHGVIQDFYIDPHLYFPFFGFDFIRPLPGDGMYILFGALAVCALFIAIGLFYRIAIVLFVLGFAYIFLIDQARYLNHFYFAGLLCFLMMFIPASRGWSVDALIAGRSQDARIPAWSLWILRVQMEIMLIYAGIVKLDPDWLQGEPLGKWLAQSSDLPVVGPLLLNDTVILIGAWGAAFLHLIGAVALLFKSTRLYAFAVYTVFHLSNHVFFNIGIFPWLTIAATTLFFDPDWPKVVWGKVAAFLRLPARLQPSLTGGAAERPWHKPSPALQSVIVSLIVAWTAFQVLLPSRHWLYPGNTGWHEQGYYFAWQMMLRQKVSDAMFYVRDVDTGREWLVDPGRLLSSMQESFMTKRPEMIRQFAHHIEKIWAERYGTRDVEVRAFTAVSLNGRRSQALVDPNRDLTKIDYTFAPSDWILPLREPMPPKGERWPSDQREVLLRNMRADPATRRLLASIEAKKLSSSRPDQGEKK